GRSYATRPPELCSLGRDATELRDLGAARGELRRARERLAPSAAFARLRQVEPEAPVGVVLGERGPEAPAGRAEVAAGELHLTQELPRLVRPGVPCLRPPRLRRRAGRVAAVGGPRRPRDRRVPDLEDGGGGDERDAG